MDYEHGHQHGHQHAPSSACCDSDHSHGHSHAALSSSCCDDDSCSSNARKDACCDSDHSHGHSHAAPSSEVPSIIPDAVVETREHQVCNSCDASSSIPHAILVSKLRVASLCCAGEEAVIRNSLKNITGIESVKVNIIGRYMVVRHCPVQCCAPVEKIIDILNAKKLGVSINETNECDEEFIKEPLVEPFRATHLLVVWLFFIAGIIVQRALSPDDTIEIHDAPPTAALALYLVAVIVGILPPLKHACVAVARQTIDINVLMVVAIAGSLVVGEYLDAALVVALFIAAELVEHVIMRWVRNALAQTGGGVAKTAFSVNLGKSVPLDQIAVGDIISVRAGDMLGIDGSVQKGECVIDESALTGEATPVQKVLNSKVYGGTVVQNGYAEIIVETDSQNSTMKKLQEAIDEVQADKGTTQKIVDRFAQYWTPIILLTAFLLVVGGGGSTGQWDQYVIQGVTLLVLACPCSIVLAAPIPSVCAIAAAARDGVLVRGSSIIEKIASVTDVACDKTGTLTKGYFGVVEALVLKCASDECDPLQLAAAVEVKSLHPLADAIVSKFCGCISEFEGELPPARKINVIEGVGVEGWVEIDGDWKHVLLGNEKILSGARPVRVGADNGAALDSFLQRNRFNTNVLVAVDDELRLLLSLADEVRENSSEMVTDMMQRFGLSVHMLTGDHKKTAENVCGMVGIPLDNCHSQLLPKDKLQWVQDSQRLGGKRIMMIGDGINDAAGLTAAHVGVAMGVAGSAMATNASDVVMMSDNLSKLVSAMSVCLLAHSIIVENCIFSIGIKVIGVVLAILGKLPLWLAMLIDIGSLVVVIFNGMRPLTKWSSALPGKETIREDEIPDPESAV